MMGAEGTYFNQPRHGTESGYFRTAAHIWHRGEVIMSKPTRESVVLDMDEFLDFFEAFDARIEERDNKAMYVKTSDRIALFAIYYKG